MLVKLALEDRRVLAFQYNGKPRLAEPHCFGTDKDGNLQLRAYQRGEDGGWKLFKLSQMQNVECGDDQFDGPRPGYKTGDRQMATIVAELPA